MSPITTYILSTVIGVSAFSFIVWYCIKTVKVLRKLGYLKRKKYKDTSYVDDVLNKHFSNDKEQEDIVNIK